VGTKALRFLEGPKCGNPWHLAGGLGVCVENTGVTNRFKPDPRLHLPTGRVRPGLTTLVEDSKAARDWTPSPLSVSVETKALRFLEGPKCRNPWHLAGGLGVCVENAGVTNPLKPNRGLDGPLPRSDGQVSQGAAAVPA
jgi:hypothetical protein